MKLSVLTALALLGLLLAACSGGGGGSDSDATPNATFEAALDQARQTPVDEPVREYASMLCDPLQKLLETAGPALESFATPEGTPDFSAAFGAAFEALGQLEGPFQQLLDDARTIDPPSELESFHQSFLADLEYSLQALRALSGGDLTGALALPSPPPTVEPPSGLDAAVIQECGPQMQDLIAEFGGSFFDNGAGFGTSGSQTPEPVQGSVGETVTHGSLSLQVHGVEDPYESTDEFLEPPAGKRWLVFDVSITNVSEEEQQVFPGLDFKAKDSAGVEHEATYIGAPNELDSGPLAAHDSERGQVAFEVPEAASIVRLTFDPGFFGEGLIDIDLR